MFNTQQTIQRHYNLTYSETIEILCMLRPQTIKCEQRVTQPTQDPNKKPSYMFSQVWLLRAMNSRSIRSCRLGSMSCPALLGQLYDHGSQLWWVSAYGCISNSWSNGANTQHQRAAIIIRGCKALVAHTWLRARTPILDRRCRSIHMVLKKTSDFMLESHRLYVLFLWFFVYIKKFSK